jgi:hypothetical protein
MWRNLIIRFRQIGRPYRSGHITTAIPPHGDCFAYSIRIRESLENLAGEVHSLTVIENREVQNLRPQITPGLWMDPPRAGMAYRASFSETLVGQRQAVTVVVAERYGVRCWTRCGMGLRFECVHGQHALHSKWFFSKYRQWVETPLTEMPIPP